MLWYWYWRVRLLKDEEGGTSVEYGLITAILAVALIVALVIFRGELIDMFQRSGDRIRSST